MFFSPRSVIFLCATFLIPFSANAAPLCEYAAYSVPALHQNIVRALAERGFSLAPAVYFSDSSAELGTFDEEYWVLADSTLYAKLSIKSGVADASSALRIMGPSGEFLASAKSTMSPCRGGWCRETLITTSLDGGSNGASDDVGIRVSQSPSYGMKYFVYNDRVGVTSWRTQFNERYEWMLDVLTDYGQSMPILAFTPMQRFVHALASDPLVMPFLNEIYISVARDGHFVVRGRVTHSVYNGIVDAAIRHGFYNIEPLMVIDSAAGSRRYPDRELIHCL